MASVANDSASDSINDGLSVASDSASVANDSANCGLNKRRTATGWTERGAKRSPQKLFLK